MNDTRDRPADHLRLKTGSAPKHQYAERKLSFPDMGGSHSGNLLYVYGQ